MPLYEFMCVASAASSAEVLAKLLQRTNEVVKQGGGVLRRVENLGLRPLADRIKAHRKYHNVGR